MGQGGNNTVSMGTNLKLNLSIGSEGLTVRICIQEGAIVVFGSYTVPNPSSALHDFSTTLNATGFDDEANCFVYYTTPADVMQNSSCSLCSSNPQGRRRRQTENALFLYITIEGASDTENQFSFNSSYGAAFGKYFVCIASYTLKFPLHESLSLQSAQLIFIVGKMDY